MLSVTVHKDIGEYTEKIVGKLSARTLACTAGGIGAAIGTAAFVYLGLGIPVSDATLPVMAASMPFWLLGFWRPRGSRPRSSCRFTWTTFWATGSSPTEPGPAPTA